MPAGESAHHSPIDGDTAPINVCNSESGDEGPRKRSASPATANQSAWGDNPAKKICTEGIGLWVESTSAATAAASADTAVPDVSQQYQENHDMLVTMGFNSDEIDAALRMSNNEVEKAIQYLTREITGLDAVTKPSSSVDEKQQKVNFLPNLLRAEFADSDEEEVAEDMKEVWEDESMTRIRTILENNHRFVVFRQNGSLHRKMIVATNIIRSGKHDRMPDVLNFVDEFLAFLIGRHVNCTDVRPGVDLLRQLLDMHPSYTGESDASAVEQFYLAITPLFCARLATPPCSVKTVLSIDEMFNYRNKFFVLGVQFTDLPDRVFPPLKYIDIGRLERLEYRHVYAYLADHFLCALIPTIDAKLDVNTEEEFSQVTLLDLQCLLRALNIFSNFMTRLDDVFLSKLESWIAKCLERFRIVSDKEVRDALTRRQGLDLLQEIVVLCDRFNMDVATTTQTARLDYLRKWIRCPQMETILHALEELGTIADRFHRTGGMTITRPKSYVNEDCFKKWLEENKVLQIVLTGNMDHVVYVERIQPILQYMTPELTMDDLKFVWSLRKGRMGVSVDNFNKIMEFISKSVNNEQIEWLIELFKKSFRNRETRLYEPIFNFCTTIAIQKDRDDECKLKISNIIWELIYIARGPPRCTSFKSLEYGMKKHCELLNMMFEKGERDAFLDRKLDDLNCDEGFNEITVVYLFIMLEKLRRLFTPKRTFTGERFISEDSLARVNELKSHLRERRLAEPILDRLAHIRQLAHDRFNAAQQANQDSQSNAVFESTSDTFGGYPTDNILSTSIYGCTDYAFILQNTFRLLKWLHDVEAAVVDVEYVQRLFSIFIDRPGSTAQEKTEIFGFLFELKMPAMRPETSRAIITHLCGMDMFSLQITGLRCFCKYWEELPILSNEDSRPVESFIVKKDNECKLFVWKLILFNQCDDVVEKCMETFCERDLVLVDSPYSVRHHTYSFLSVFSFYVEKLKSELYKRSNKTNSEITYDTKELAMNDEEIAQHDVPLDDMLTETISRALNRLVRFMTRFVELGNEKNHMLREAPSHGSSISGHPVTLSIELRNDDDDSDCAFNTWKTFVCDSSTTIGEFKVRLAKRLLFHEAMQDFTVHKREDDLTMGEANLRYDFLTLQDVKLASETDSIFLSEKLRILVKPRKPSSRRNDLHSQVLQKKALREDFLPISIISKCNFYDLLHELSSNGDKHMRASVRRLLLLLPTQPSLLKQLTFYDMEDEEDEPLTFKLHQLYSNYMSPADPGRLLYALEAMSAVVAPTRLTHSASEETIELTNAILESDIVKSLTNDILNKPHVVPLNKCSAGDRHAIFERILQIVRTVYTGRNTFIKTIRNEYRVREEMKKTCDRLSIGSDTSSQLDSPMDYALIRQQILPPCSNELQNNPTYATSQPMCFFKTAYLKIVIQSLRQWELADLITFLESIRNFQWVHVATESVTIKEIAPYADISDPAKQNASDIIRVVTKGERWGDECRLIIVKKAFSLIRHMVRDWVQSHQNMSMVLLQRLFLENRWIQFYEDVLVNSQQEAYRKYVQENIVKIGKDSFIITTTTLKMLIEIFMALPFHNGHTLAMNELEKRQRQHCDGIVQTIIEIFQCESHRRCRETKLEIDWGKIGYSPNEIIKGQIKSLLNFKPRFSSTNNDLSLTENIYAAAKMRMINCFLPHCDLPDIEDFSIDFVDSIINDFLFPEVPDIEDSMFEEESIRWEHQAREAAVQTLNSFCEKSYKNCYQLLLLWSKFACAHKPYDPSYRPIIRGRQFDKVGMKNDGGTCYMNAMIQQLVHVPGLSKELIAIQNIDHTLSWGDNTSALLCELQRAFAQLNFSQCQAIVPYGLWREFRFEPDMPLNTKQHHDAIDFYSILLDKCDNVLKKLELPQLFQNRFFGKYSYEKICYGCWHRYKSPDEEFNCVSLALSGDNLEEALENFLAAHVMEGENAYHCEKCNEKKTTLNRSSFLELPSTMTIQLKRFTYDLVNNMIRKDNQYFKFPFEIDMTPYMTNSRHVPDEHVQDLFDDMLLGNTCDEPATPPHKNGSLEKSGMGAGSASTPSLESPQKKLFRRHRSSTMRLSQSFANTSGFDTPVQQQKPLIYELVGVLAHSGIATAGHYYSFIKERREEYRDSPTYGKWYHVNDMTVSPMPLSNIDDIWFGGTFTQEGVFIGLDERIRHWNAYVLFYEKKRDEPNVLIPRHIIDRLQDARPKVTFDVSDEQMDDGYDKIKEAQDALKKDLSEARRLRIRMFNSLDDNLKKFLNDEYCKFLEDRDFFSFDLYHIYVNSLLPVIKKDDSVEYNVTDVAKPEFFKMTFEYIASYIIRVAWTMFDDARPKNFPKSATELIRSLLFKHPDNKFFFFKALEANNAEMLNRMLDVTENDIKKSFWTCMRIAMKLWVQANGKQDGNADPSPDSIEFDDEDDEDDEDEDDDDDLDDEDSESEEQYRHETLRPNPMALVSQLVLGQQRLPMLKPSFPADLSKLNLIRRVVQVIPFRVHRMDNNGKRFLKELLELIYFMTRVNEFGRTVLYVISALPLIAEFMFDDYSTHTQIFCRVRFTEERMKALGFWPLLPQLYLELLLDHLKRGVQQFVDPHMTYRHAVMTTQGNYVADFLRLYSYSRQEHSKDTKNEDEKSVHNRIVACYVAQVQLFAKSENPDAARDYVFQLTQVMLKESTINCIREESWPYTFQFIAAVGEGLANIGLPNLGTCFMKNFLWVGVAEDDEAVLPGMLPVMEKLSVTNRDRFKKLLEAVVGVKQAKHPALRAMLRRLHHRFKDMCSLLAEDNEYDSDEFMDDEEFEEFDLDDEPQIMIGPQMLRRAPNSVDLTKPSTSTTAVATARVFETKEINLEEDLKSSISDDNFVMNDQPSLEEISNNGSSSEDLNMISSDDLPNENED